MITIIGSGWYGCYLGLKLKSLGVRFEILEKESEIFCGSSSYNQNRLHLGYHYPRDYYTRKSSLEGFQRFVKEFPELSSEVKGNIYAVHKDSILDFETYSAIFSQEKYAFTAIDPKTWNIGSGNYEGLVDVKERLIDVKKSKQFFLDLALPIRFNTICSYNGPNIFANGKEIASDLIFDCTYGQMECPNGYYTEDFLSLVYQKIRPIPFEALTVMDGEFYSIYPYYADLYTVTGVKEGIVNLAEYSNLGEEEYVSERRGLLENKIIRDYKTFLLDFKFVTFFISKKMKPRTNTDKRSTHVLSAGHIHTICSGKIDTIFELDSLLSSKPVRDKLRVKDAVTKS